MAKVRINKTQLMKEIGGAITDKISRDIRIVAEREVAAANAELLERFLTNEITAEIASGPDASNTSGLLGGYGNLFSFLGFDEGANPVQELAHFLAKSIKIKAIVKNKQRVSVSVRIEIPSIEDFDFAELPWATTSWISAIENGISGLGRYLYSDYGFSESRSDNGIQAEAEIRGGQLSGTKYLSAMIEDIAKKLISGIRNASKSV